MNAPYTPKAPNYGNVIDAAARFRSNVVAFPVHQLGCVVETMIQTQMGAYPEAWSEQERREAAEAWLRGPGDAA